MHTYYDISIATVTFDIYIMWALISLEASNIRCPDLPKKTTMKLYMPSWSGTGGPGQGEWAHHLRLWQCECEPIPNPQQAGSSVKCLAGEWLVNGWWTGGWLVSKKWGTEWWSDRDLPLNFIWTSKISQIHWITRNNQSSSSCHFSGSIFNLRANVPYR